MSTTRRRYTIAVTLYQDHYAAVGEGHHGLIRKNDGLLTWAWCHHEVRATSNQGAITKAIRQHKDQTTCQALDEEVRQCWREYRLS